MQHKFKLAALSSMLCANAFATPIYQPPGPNLTYGSSSNNQSIMSSIANPAAAAAQLGKEDSQYRFGLINIGGGYEFGDVNDLYNQIDRTEAKLTNAEQLDGASLYDADRTVFVQNVADYINLNVTANVNGVLNAVQKDGNATVFFGGHVPLTPFVISRKGWGGSFVLDANVSAIANMTFISDPIADFTTAQADALVTEYETSGTMTYDPTVQTTDSTLLVKAAAVGEIGLGYSRSVLRREAPELKEGEPTPGKLSASELKAGELTAGVRAKYYQVKLARKAQRLTQTTGGAEDTFDSDLIYTTSSGFGLDVGTLWTSKHYRAGAWINNLKFTQL